jgi:hypothetical protein
MSREATRIVHAMLDTMPAEDRLALLVATIVERRPGALSALVSMSAVLAAMARHLSERDKIALSEVLRDVADAVEQRVLVDV